MIAGDDAVEIARISLSFYQTLATAIRAARKIRAGPPTVESGGNRLSRNRADMYPSVQVIVLLGLIIERPAAVEEVALMPGVGEGDREACLGQG